MSTATEKSVIDILLESEVPKPQEKKFKHKRLSKKTGKDVVFTLREIGFSRVAEIKSMHENVEEMDVHTVLAGVKEPIFKSAELKAKYGAATPAELVKAMLRPGEIAEIAKECEKLSGYRMRTLEEVEDTEKK